MRPVWASALRGLLIVPAIAATSSAQSPTPGGGSSASAALTRDDVEMRAATNFGMLDSDEDGALTAKEISAPRQTVVRQNEFTKNLMKDVFSEMDADKSGWLNVAEYTDGQKIERPPMAESFFAAADTDKDQKLSLQEIQTLFAKVGDSKAFSEDFLKRFDADRDSDLNVAEVNAGISLMQTTYEKQRRLAAEEFTRLDADRNSQVTPDEFLKAIPPTAPLRTDAAMSDYDSDHDGKITLAEFRARALAEFDRRDLNKDGVIQGTEQTRECTKGFGSATFLDPAETLRPLCNEAGK